MEKELSIEEFLDKKNDFSPFLVHLTKDSPEISTDGEEFTVPAKYVFEWILDEKNLKAFNHFCLFDSDLEKPQNVCLRDKFRVVCFTETPIGQIDVLLNKVSGRNFKPEPYGLVFKKEYITESGGNPVFYVSGHLFAPLWWLYNDAKERSFSEGDNRVLALVNKCDEKIDFHWEREWRIVGNLKFDLDTIYCGLCPEKDISEFEDRYPVIFIDPYWGINKILNKLVNLSKKKDQPYVSPLDIPF